MNCPPPLQGLMQNCNQMHACYLFQQDKHYDLSYDTGDKALQCGRHVDIFKLWLMWRAKVSPQGPLDGFFFFFTSKKPKLKVILY